MYNGNGSIKEKNIYLAVFELGEPSCGKVVMELNYF